MFDFALKPTRSVEELLAKPGEIEDSFSVSAGEQQMILEDALSGIIYSAVAHLSVTDMPADVINAKMRDLAEQFKRNGDITQNQLDYILKTDFVRSYSDRTIFEGCCPDEKFDKWEAGYWGILRNVKRAIKNSYQWGGSDIENKLNDREKALIKAVHEAQEALYKATEEYWKYTQVQAVLTIDELLKKYADPLGKIDQNWYNALLRSSKYHVDEVERLKAAKKTEDDVAASRPIAAS